MRDTPDVKYSSSTNLEPNERSWLSTRKGLRPTESLHAPAIVEIANARTVLVIKDVIEDHQTTASLAPRQASGLSRGEKSSQCMGTPASRDAKKSVIRLGTNGRMMPKPAHRGEEVCTGCQYVGRCSRAQLNQI